TVDGLLAELGEERVDLIKMDVEGSEVAAIRGMSRLLSRADAPLLVYESNGHTLSWFDETPSHLLAVLEEFGYRNYLVKPGRLVPFRAGDLQADMVADYLAAKHLPAMLPGWRVAPPPGQRQMAAMILAASVDPHEQQRAYAGHALSGADPALLSNGAVRDALDCLSIDPVADVRAAVSWWTRAGPAEKATLAARAGHTRRYVLCKWRRLIRWHLVPSCNRIAEQVKRGRVALQALFGGGPAVAAHAHTDRAVGNEPRPEIDSEEHQP
ncbi:MAG: FkbM family methyltransferase, partial [Anaerolineae bacterium]|nr:FkbM family methyltransferase [Anaerolineae bacterium]